MAAARVATSSWERNRIGSVSTLGGLTARNGFRPSNSFSTAAPSTRLRVR